MKINVEQTLRKAASLAKKGKKIEAGNLYYSVLQAYPGNLRAKQSLEALGIRASDNKRTTVLDEHLKELWALFNTKAYNQVIDNAKNILKNFAILHRENHCHIIDKCEEHGKDYELCF